MRNLKSFAVTSCLGAVALMFAPGASADQWNKKTILTVNETIQIPGAVLEPGKYVMKLMESPANRHVVQVFNEREDKLHATILAVSNYRLEATGDTQFQWWETSAGEPKALRAWFYPGDNFGQEFAYPRNESLAIAQRTGEQVPTTYAENQADLATARVGILDREGTEMELDRETYTRADGMQPSTPAPVEPARQTQQQTEVAQAQVPQADVVEPTPQFERAEDLTQTRRSAAEEGRTLPRTGSLFPLIGLAGFLALGTSVAVRAIAKRS